jgi:hypothetical protein
VASPARDHAHEPVPFPGERFEGPAHLLGMHDEDHPLLLRESFRRIPPGLFAYGFGKESLPLGRRGPQRVPVRLGLPLEDVVPLAPLLYVLLYPVYDPLYSGDSFVTHPPTSFTFALTSTLLGYRLAARHAVDLLVHHFGRGRRTLAFRVPFVEDGS